MLDRSQPSLDGGSVSDAGVVDLGTAIRGVGGVINGEATVHNIEQAVGFTAALEIESVESAGAPGPIEAAPGELSVIPAGGSAAIDLSADVSAYGGVPGEFTALLTVQSSDDRSIPGAGARTPLTVAVTLTIEGCPGDTSTPGNPADGVVDLDDLLTVLSAFGEPSDPWLDGDVTGDAAVDLADLLAVLAAFGTSCG